MTTWALSLSFQKFGAAVNASSSPISLFFLATSKTVPQITHSAGQFLKFLLRLFAHGTLLSVRIPLSRGDAVVAVDFAHRANIAEFEKTCKQVLRE